MPVLCEEGAALWQRAASIAEKQGGGDGKKNILEGRKPVCIISAGPAHSSSSMARDISSAISGLKLTLTVLQ